MTSNKRRGSLAPLVAVALMSLVWNCSRGPRPWTPGGGHAPGTKEFDLHAGRVDYNGFMVNPSWVSQSPGVFPPKDDACKKKPYTGACTTQNPSLDEARFPNVLICSFEFGSAIKGHANWAAASSVGEVLWLNLAADGDYNFMFFPNDEAGLTGNNGLSTGVADPPRRYIELEFDSRETIAHFATDWWQKFDKVVHEKRQGEEIQKLLNPDAPRVAARAVVSGLFGLDCEHDCHSEFHPLYATAIEVNSAPGQNQWAIFVRNWGNEGFCSSLDHQLQLPERKLRLTLPRRGTRPRVTSAATQFASSRAEIPFPEVAFDTLDQQDGQVVLTFTLPPPEKRVDGEMLLTLDWPASPTPKPTMRYAPGGAARSAGLEEKKQGAESPEGYLDRALAGRTIAPTAPLEAAVRARAVARNVVVPTPPVVNVVDFQRPTIQPQAARGRLPKAPNKPEQDRAIVKAICDAYRQANEPLPTFNGRDVSAMCKGIQ